MIFYTNEIIMRKGNKELVRNDEDNKNSLIGGN